MNFLIFQVQIIKPRIRICFKSINMDSSSKTISDLPNEILVMIFEKLKLNKMSDIVSIKNTCTKWENVIELMFNFKDKGMFITYNLLKTIFNGYFC